MVELEEEVEGNHIGTKNYRFSKIGDPVPIKPDADSEFDAQNPPSQPLAVSERLRLLFVAHSTGFCVAKTKDVMESAKAGGTGSSIQELSVVDVPIGKVSILALSADSSTLAATIASDLHFFSVTALLNQERKPAFSCSLNDSICIKDMRWTTKLEKYYVLLSSNGELYYGAGYDPLKDVMDNVDAVEWSVEGDFVAVARKNVLSLLSSKFKEKMSMSLSFKSFIGDSDVNCIVKVDSIRWVRPDCIIIGCVGVTDDGNEENYLVQVITSKDGKITNATNPIVLSFNDVFLGLVDDAVPFGSGPHMFLSYLDQCELAFIGNRKNMDQHIALFDWSLDDKNEAAMIEILNDAWLPRIDCQGNGDDNLVLGLSVDKVSHDERVTLVLGEEEKEVSPCCVLLCLTVDGKLSMFHFASAAAASVSEVVSSISDEEHDTPPVFPSEHRLSEISSRVEEQSVVQVLGLQSQDVKDYGVNTDRGDESPMAKEQQPPAVHKSLSANPYANTKPYDERTPGNKEVNPLVNSQIFKGDEQQKVTGVKLKQDDQQLFSGEQRTSLEHSLLMTSYLEGPRPVVRDFNKNETQKHAEARSSADSFSGKFLTDMSNQSIGRDSQKGLEVAMELQGKIGSSSLQSAASQSLSSGKLISSKVSDGRSSFLPSSDVQRNQSDSSGTILNTLNVPGGPLRNPSSSKEIAGASPSVHPSGHRVSMGAGNVQSLPSAHSSQLPLQETFTLGKSSNHKFHSNKGSYRTPSPTGVLNSEQNLSKQFLNVEEMAKELDNLLECIEGVGGFKDTSIALQKSSVVALEEGIWALSDRCRISKCVMDERLGKIQFLLDKTVQVLARKIYMEGIVKQATDSRYWDLWNLQKLSSEFELKQRHILEVNQDLTNQLIELERHFNTIEFNKFGENGGVQMNRRAFPTKHGPSRHVQSLHSLHNTMSAQLAAAEQLSECLSKQMAVLSIESPSVKKQNVRKELFETIGIPYNGASFNSPGGEKDGDTPSKNKLLTSSCSAIPKEQSWRNQTSAAMSSEPETARRRRDSLDRNWATFEPPKTTVKRMLLQEDRQTVSTNRSSLSMDKPQLNPHLLESSAIARANHRTTTSTFSYPSKGKGSQDTPTNQSSENQSTSFFQWADDIPDLSHPIAGFSAVPSQSASQSALTVSQNSARNTSKLTPERSRSGVTFIGNSDSLDVNESKSVQQSEIGPSKPNIGSLKHKPVIAESSIFESRKSRDFPFSPVSAAGLAPSLFEAATSNVQPGENISSPMSSLSVSPSWSLPMVDSSSASSFSLPKPTAPTSSSAMSSGRLSTSSKANVQQIASQSGSSASSSRIFSSTSSSESSDKPVPSSTTPPSMNVTSKSLNTEVAKFSFKTDENSSVQTSSPLSDLPTGTSSFKLESSVSSRPTSELSSSSQSGSRLSFSLIASTASNGALNPKPAQPSAAPVLSAAALSSSATDSAGKNDSSDYTFTQEDEMEEEAPEISHPTELPLGNLGGFGIGSAPNPTASKPNPFGGPFVNTTANPPSSPFTMTVPSGELFRPSSFSFPSPQPSQPSQPTNFGIFSGGFSTGTTDQIPNGGNQFGQPAQTGSGQRALGSVLGAFGQSRQIGTGLAGSGVTSASGFGGGFGVNQSTGGFSNAATGGGFANLPSAGGGFSGVASAGGGFAAAATAGGGFGAAASAGAGFAGAASGSGFSMAGGGFGAFGNQQGSGSGFSAFGSSGGAGRPPSELFTQIRK